MNNKKNKIQVLKLSIKNKRTVADGTTEITFNNKGKKINFIPGQYIRITLPDLSDKVKGGNTRDFNISSSPSLKNTLTITFRNSDSAFKKKLLKTRLGTKVQVQGPLGFFVLPLDKKVPLAMVAGGIGVTPFLSMIRFSLEKKENRKIQLIYANTNKKRAAYLEELRLLDKQNSNFTLIEKKGRLTSDFLKNNVNFSQKTLWYLCGIPEMTAKLVRDIPKKLDVLDFNIRLEEYTGYSPASKNYKILPPVDAVYFDQSELNKRLLQPLLDAVGQGALVAVTDAQGSILYINDKFVEISKYSRNELIGQNHRILKSGHHQPKFYQELWKTISSGKIWRGEIKNQAKDGTFYWVDTSITPMFEKNKKIDRYVAVRFLISDKKNLELAKKEIKKSLELAKKEKNKLNTILYGIGDGVFVVNKDLKIILFNVVCEQLSGFSAKEAMGKPYQKILKFIHEKNKKTNDFFIKKAIKTGKNQTMNDVTQLIKKDGSYINVADSAAPLKDKKGRVIGVVVVFRDVTKERQIDKAKNEFISLASHQLRTPLSSINWQTGFLLEGTLGKVNKEIKEYLVDIHQSNLHMIDLVNGLLNTSRIDLGTFAIDPKPVDLKKVVESVLKELEQKIIKKKLILTKKYSKNLSKILADPSLMRIVFQNLLSNAIKYNPEKGKINLEITKQNKKIIIKVQDTGMGIPKKEQTKIFTKLFRTDIVQQAGIEGTGLGLYIVKAIANESGGKTWFESEVSKGTTFYFSLPIKGMKKKKGTKGLS